MKKIDDRIFTAMQYASKIDMLEYYMNKIINYDSFITLVERRDIEKIQEQLIDYEKRFWSGKKPLPIQFLRKFMAQNNLNIDSLFLISDHKKSLLFRIFACEKEMDDNLIAIINKKWHIPVSILTD